MSSRAPAIGIDLGTNQSCVSVCKHGRVKIIANDMGSRLTPSIVAFTDIEVFIGEAAVYQAGRNPHNTIYGAKRIIGRTFIDSEVQEDMKHWPFAVIDDEGYPKIRISTKRNKKTFYLEEIIALILKKMKETAEAFLNQPVTSAVITVPAYFNDRQRSATRDAAIIAGLNVLRIINEPTAAAIAYGLETKAGQEQNVLIFDLGGGTCDVSILFIKDGYFKVRATAGNTHLGGEDFDNRLVDYFVEEFKREHTLDLNGNKRAIHCLRAKCEQAKRILSTNTHVDIEIAIEGIEYVLPISRARFDDLNEDLFQATIDCVKKALQDAEIDKTTIDEVVLVGGSTRIPKVQKLLQEFFDGKELNKTINPDEAVAYGAAVHAAVLNGDKDIGQIVLEDVAPLSLGVAINGRDMAVVIPRNTTIPTKKTEMFCTKYDNQTAVVFPVYEGERASVEDNNFLGQLTLHDVKRLPAKVEKFGVTFAIDANGILKVSAVNIRSGKRKEITIAKKGRLSKATIERLTQVVDGFSLEISKSSLRNSLKLEFEFYCINTRNFLQNCPCSKNLTDGDKNHLLELICSECSWMVANGMAEPQEYEHRLQELQKTCDSIIGKIPSV